MRRAGAGQSSSAKKPNAQQQTEVRGAPRTARSAVGRSPDPGTQPGAPAPRGGRPQRRAEGAAWRHTPGPLAAHPLAEAPRIRSAPRGGGAARRARQGRDRALRTVDGPQAPVVGVLHMAPRRHDESAEPQCAAAGPGRAGGGGKRDGHEALRPPRCVVTWLRGRGEPGRGLRAAGAIAMALVRCLYSRSSQLCRNVLDLKLPCGFSRFMLS